MKRATLWIPVTAAGIFVLWQMFIPERMLPWNVHQRDDSRVMGLIRGGIQRHLDSGGQLPTNWQQASNVVDWKAISDICGRSWLPLPTEGWLFLKTPVLMETAGRTGYVFLVRLRAYDHSRCALKIGSVDPNSAPTADLSNYVSDVWLDDRRLPGAILTQLERVKAR